LRRGNQTDNHRSDTVDQYLDTARVRMQTIRLIEVGFHRYTLQKEWVKRRAMGARQLGKYQVERVVIVGTPIGRRQHAQNQDPGADRSDLVQHFAKIGTHRRRVDPAQCVVGAERQYYEIGFGGQGPIEPCQAVGGGVSRDPGIDDLGRNAVGAQPRFEARWKRLFRHQAVSRRQAVAKIENDRNVRCPQRGRGEQYHQRRAGHETAKSVENALHGAISSGVLPPADRRRRSSWLRPNMTSSLHSGGPLVVVDNVDLTLGSSAGPVNILRRISFEIAAGATIALVGPSGSGKSSLLMILAGLERPTAGRVLIDGRDLGLLDEDALARLRRRRIGIVFQAFHLIPTMTALENVALPLELAGDRDAFAAARRGLDAVGLGHRLGHYPAQLSGGEQQRVAIARAFIAGPKLLLADEPTGNLDIATSCLVMDCLFEARARHGTSLLLITHDESLAARCARRIRLADGVVVEDRLVAMPQYGTARRIG
jgi:putative ABC transport system ATP-binding protein